MYIEKNSNALHAMFKAFEKSITCFYSIQIFNGCSYYIKVLVLIIPFKKIKELTWYMRSDIREDPTHYSTRLRAGYGLVDNLVDRLRAKFPKNLERET